MSLRIHFLTLGCPKNEVDSDRMAAAVDASGYERVLSEDDADVVVLNTCSFIREAVEESVDCALTLARDWRSERDGRYLVVAGCMPSRYGEELAGAMPEADAFVPVADEPALLETLERLSGVPARASLAEARPRTAPGPSAYLQISDGCFRRCAYCTIPSIRGPYRSRTLPEIEREASLLAEGGAKEIVLIGQDTSAWGRDLAGEHDVTEVLRTVAAVEGVEWVRLMYVQPDGVTPRLLEEMAAQPKVCDYLDIPLQHASADVLRRMSRTGDGGRSLEMIELIRAHMPDVVLRSTFIAGFPGETEEDVAELEAFLRAARLDYAGVFAFSPEDGTPAARMRPRPPAAERRRRAQLLRDVADEIGFQKAAEHVGATLQVLVEGVDEEGVAVGRWRGQAPEVDGVVLCDVRSPAGSCVSVRIVDSLGYDLVGEVLT